MTHRILGILITIVWIVMLTALVQRDVMPFWRAQDPPSAAVPPGDYQVAIVHENGRRLGTSWVTTLRLAETTTVHGMTVIDLTGILPVVSRLRLESTLSYDKNDALDEFQFRLDTDVASAKIAGERYDTEFACIAEIGPHKRQMSLDARLSSYLSDSMRPFTHLGGLTVGQSWRLRVLDPMALIRGEEPRFNVQLVRVTKRETIEHRGEKIECFRIETERTTAWADDTGRVLRQEVVIPFLGTWNMLDEPFDSEARQAARQAIYELRKKTDGDLREEAARLMDEADRAADDLDEMIQNSKRRRVRRTGPN